MRLTNNALTGPHKIFVPLTVKKYLGNTLQKYQSIYSFEKSFINESRRDILRVYNTGSGVYFRSTKKQLGGGIVTILASIGIPLGIEVIKQLTGRGLPCKNGSL